MKIKTNKIGILSNSTLKIIACILMLIDHIGAHLLPHIFILRLIGRLSFPIFAFLIAEGCKYTKNKLKHFLLLFSMGLFYLIFVYLYANMLFGSIFITFSFSILYIYLLQLLKKFSFSNKYILPKILLSIIIFIILLFPSYCIFNLIEIDYEFSGMLIPVIISIFDLKKYTNNKYIKYIDNLYTKLFILSILLILYSLSSPFGIYQFFSLFALIPLCLYNEKPGNKKLKYGFYLFYPVHLIIIEIFKILI
jgi:hypothetical protein